MTAYQVMELTGEVITTPYSFVATTHAMLWNKLTPVFCDVDPVYGNLDPNKIEALITEKTTAIVPVHVYGNPAEVEKIEAIGKKYKLKVIYDAAHCFGVTYNNQSIFNYGDVSTCSFHATKLFHTGEGGALFCKSFQFEKMFAFHNFGHDGPEAFQSLGINAKMSEPQAAMGLAVLPYMKSILNARQWVCQYYDAQLNNSSLKKLKIRENTNWNYSYYPILFEDETQLLNVVLELNKLEIFPRRYFYPSLNTVHYVDNKAMPISEYLAKRILCLPLYLGLNEQELNLICKTININL
jgi:dTDP-4-amino-4,6-dideoxygalactose transaminase